MQLGHSRVPYMQIRISYSHSAFPDDFRSEMMTGVSGMRSRIETVVTASLTRHSTVSPWSPRPTPAPNSLFQLIERHWGADKARQAMQQILAQRSTPRKAAQAGLGTYHETSAVSTAAVSAASPSRNGPPVVPTRQASIQSAVEPQSSPAQHFPSQRSRYGYPSCSRRAPKVDDSQQSLSSTGIGSSSKAWWSDRSPSSQSRNSGSARRALGSDGLRSLVPRLADFTFETLDESKRGSLAIERAKGKKEMSRWGWTNWFSS